MNEKTGQSASDRALFEALREQSKSLVMATVGVNGSPRASYAPFVRASGFFYVYLSRLSDHTRDLIETPLVSVMLIEDEAAADQVFARRRVTYGCDSRIIGRDEKDYHAAMALFTRRFGNLMDVLRSLPDFVLFRLAPSSGRFVTGFGKAYELAGERLEDLVHIGPRDLDNKDNESREGTDSA
jgi:putative heme iron utilization protein